MTVRPDELIETPLINGFIDIATVKLLDLFLAAPSANTLRKHQYLAGGLACDHVGDDFRQVGLAEGLG